VLKCWAESRALTVLPAISLVLCSPQVAALETLSPDQKAELLLDPSTGALENVTVVKEVLSSILKSPDENQLEKFFEKFVEVSKEVSFFFFHLMNLIILIGLDHDCDALEQEGSVSLPPPGKRHLHHKRGSPRHNAEPDFDCSGSQIPPLPNE